MKRGVALSLSLSQRYALLFLGYQSLQLKCTTSQPACQTENFKKEVWIARSLPNVLELYCKFFSLQYIPTDTLGKIKNAYNIHSHLLKSSRFGKSLICFGQCAIEVWRAHFAIRLDEYAVKKFDINGHLQIFFHSFLLFLFLPSSMFEIHVHKINFSFSLKLQ